MTTPSDPRATNDSPATPVPQLDIGQQNAPIMDELEAALVEVCRSGAFVFGPQVRELERRIADYCQTEHAIGCASGSDALLLALAAYDVGPGDEVILPSFTFFATAGAVWRLGAKPVFADILPDTMNIDPADIEAKITSATRAIIPVHLFGQCADMDAINKIAAAHELPVIEDAAQAIGAEQHDRRAGSFGAVGCFSFYPTKNLGGCGDGGMLTTNDDQLADKLTILRNHGQEPRYYHAVVGMNSRLDTLQAAALLVKLNHLDRWTELRGECATRYTQMLQAAGLDGKLQLPIDDPHGHSAWNQYTIRIPNGQRDALQKHLAEAKIGSAIYYPVPLHRQQCFSTLGYEPGSLPVTEQAAAEVLSLPIFAELTVAQQQRVVDGIASFFAPQRTAIPAAHLPVLGTANLPSTTA